MPNPAGADGPPTPAIGLGALLADRALELRLVAGPERAEVHGVHASEMADPSPYLLGGELLLTAGAGPAESGATAGTGSSDASDAADAADAYVRRLVGSGVAALGFGVAPLHAQVPPELARACARHGLPLLEVPPPTRFTAVARAVWRLMAEARTRELRRVTEAQQALAAAAARPDPVPAVLRRLASSLNGWAAVLTPPSPAGPSGGAGGAGPVRPAEGAGAARGARPTGATGGAVATGTGRSAGGVEAAGAGRGAEGGPVGVSASAGAAPSGEAVAALAALAGRVA
ncbi:PucR family transcriptional regulator ligand-binding domain-containing protein, partial [Streptomyces vinaceus]